MKKKIIDWEAARDSTTFMVLLFVIGFFALAGFWTFVKALFSWL